MVEKLMFIGAKDLGCAALESVARLAPSQLKVAVTVRDEDDGARSKLAEFESLAQASGFDLRVLTGPSGLAGVIEEFEPDLCLVAGWYWMIRPDLLTQVPEGFVGFHASRLPEYRGGSPLVWAVINGLDETAMSMFYLVEGMDSGDLVAQQQISIGADETIGDVLLSAEEAVNALLAENLPALLAGTAARTTQDHSAATYVAMRQPDDGEIDWRDPATAVYDFIRAQTHPYPGAFTHTPDGGVVRLWSARLFEAPFWGPPGKVALVRDDESIITCGKGAVVVSRVQLDGADEVPAAEVLKFGIRLGR